MFASQQHEHFIPIHVVDPTAQYTRNFKNSHHFPNPNSDYTPAHSNSPPTMSLDHMDMMMPGSGSGHDPDFPPNGQIHKIEIPNCFRQSEEPAGNSNQRKQGPPPPINIHAETMGQNPNQNQNQCPQAQAMYNNFMEQQQQQQQQQNPINSSPLNSPSFNGQGIRHIPIFFEGKKQAQPQNQQQNQNSQQNNNNNCSNNNNNNHTKNQSSSTSHNNNNSNNNNKNINPISSIPIPLPSPIPIPVQNKSSSPVSNSPTFNFNQDHLQNSNEEPKAPPRQKNCNNSNNNNNNHNNSNSNSDNEAQPPLKKPTPSHSNSPSPPSTPKAKTAMERVHLISEDVKKLEKDVQDFKGQSKTKEYLYLDEMLTRNLLRLDDICVEGQMEVRLARKECINLVNNTIAKLENKIESNNNNNNNSDCTEIVPFVQNNNQSKNQIIAIPVIDERNKRNEVHLIVNGGEA